MSDFEVIPASDDRSVDVMTWEERDKLAHCDAVEDREVDISRAMGDDIESWQRRQREAMNDSMGTIVARDRY
jgi:hypothetical protein